MNHIPIKIFGLKVINSEKRIIQIEFIDKMITVQFVFMNPKKDYWNQWADSGVSFENAYIDSNVDLVWGKDYEIAFHSDLIYFEKNREL